MTIKNLILAICTPACGVFLGSFVVLLHYLRTAKYGREVKGVGFIGEGNDD